MSETTCYSFSEITLLKYVEGSLVGEEREHFEAHLLECESCLQEVTDLIRIGAQMDAGVALKREESFKISVFVEDGKIKNFISNLPAKIAQGEAVRGTDTEDKYLEAERSQNLSLVILKDGEGFFKIALKGTLLNGSLVELTEKESGAPIFMKRCSEDFLVVAGLEAGKYLLKVQENSTEIEILTEK